MKYAIRTALSAAVVMTAYACKPATAEPMQQSRPPHGASLYRRPDGRRGL